MSEFELEFLSYNLEFDISEFTERYLINMSKGVTSYGEMFKVYLLNQYMPIIVEYDVKMIDINPLTPAEMRNILTHINVILNKNYNYDFEQSQSIF